MECQSMSLLIFKGQHRGALILLRFQSPHALRLEASGTVTGIFGMVGIYWYSSHIQLHNPTTASSHILRSGNLSRKVPFAVPNTVRSRIPTTSYPNGISTITALVCVFDNINTVPGQMSTTLGR